MNTWSIFLLAIALVFPARAAELEWLTSYPDALQKAAAEDKVVLLDFTGSDWCIWCKKLKKEVFDQPEFIAFAKENLVVVEVDFPTKKLPPEQERANDKLAAEFEVKGYPTLFFVDKNGKKLDRGGYKPGGPKAFIDAAIKIRGYHWKTATAPAQAEEIVLATPAPAPAPPKDIPYVPSPAPAPIHYDALSLKGISGSKNKRLALINNQTLAVGEKASVKVDDKQIKVECKEIGDDYVLILIEGEKEPRELTIGKINLSGEK